MLNSLYLLLMFVSTGNLVQPENVPGPNHKEYYELLVKTGVVKKHPLTKYIVSIKYQDHATSYAESHLCAGVIVTKWAVVTSAHCLLDENNNELNPENLIVMGSFTYGSIYDEHLQKRVLLKTLLHPDFSRKTFAHDIAILVVNNSFNFIKDQIEQVEISKKSASAYDRCSVLGFGVMPFKDVKLTEILEQSLQIWPQDACETYLSKNSLDSSGKFCAGDFQNSKDAPCVGLASEPLLCKHIAQGISLYNIGCDTNDGFAAVYADLTYYSDWISDHVEGSILYSNVNVQCPMSRVVVVLNFFMFFTFMRN